MTLGSTQPLTEMNTRNLPGGKGNLSPEVKQPGREADHSHPTSAEVKETWVYTSTLPIRLHGVVFN
jgi:hypothetical protein